MSASQPTSKLYAPSHIPSSTLNSNPFLHNFPAYEPLHDSKITHAEPKIEEGNKDSSFEELSFFDVVDQFADLLDEALAEIEKEWAAEGIEISKIWPSEEKETHNKLPDYVNDDDVSNDGISPLLELLQTVAGKYRVKTTSH